MIIIFLIDSLIQLIIFKTIFYVHFIGFFITSLYVYHLRYQISKMKVLHLGKGIKLQARLVKHLVQLV